MKIVPQLGCVSQDSDALVSQRGKTVPGKPNAKSFGTDSKRTVHHTSPKRARELIAIYQTMYHSLSLVYQRVLPPQRPHLLRHHLHHTHLTSTDTPEIQHQKEVEVRVRSYGEIRFVNPQKPKTKIKMKDAKKHKAIYCMTCRTGCRISEKIWSMKVALQNRGETLRQRIKTLPVPHMN